MEMFIYQADLMNANAKLKENHIIYYTSRTLVK